MADLKISQLNAITTLTPATDVLPVVDSGGVTKKITTNQILGSGGTATLASATITGALDAARLNVTGATIPANGVYLASANKLSFSAASTLGMTLDATGLGVGTVPVVGNGKFQVKGGQNYDAQFDIIAQFSDVTTAAAKGVLLGYNNTTNNGIISAAYGNGTEGLTFWTHNGSSWGQRMELTATGNVGIGVTPTVGKVQTNGAFVTTGAVGSLGTNPLGNALIADFSTTTRLIATGANTTTAGVFKFINASSNASVYLESMTLDASGNLIVGTTSALSSGSTFQNLGVARQVLTLKGDASGSYTFGVWNASTTNDGLFQYFATETTLTVRGGIGYNRAGGLVSYNTTSDYRAKDIIGPVSNSGSLIDSLKVYVGKMKGATIERPMLIAHEAQEVAPYAVTGTKDEVDADGNPKYQQMDASALVPLLIAEIQSLRARVQNLETR